MLQGVSVVLIYSSVFEYRSVLFFMRGSRLACQIILDSQRFVESEHFEGMKFSFNCNVKLK